MSARTKKPAASKAAPLVIPTGLRALNDHVEQARRSSDFLYRAITDPTGIDLRALVAKIRTHLLAMADEYRAAQQRFALSNELQKRVTSAFANKTLTDDDFQTLVHLLDKQCGLANNANDDKARIAQLGVVFSILSVDIDVRRLLVEPSRHVARFTSDGSVVAPPERHAVDDDRATNLIDKNALTLFLQHNAKQLTTAHNDGLITTFEYVDRCVEAYLAYLPTLSARTARALFTH